MTDFLQRKPRPIQFGTGDPENITPGFVGDIYLRLDSGVGVPSNIYQKRSDDAGVTGWEPLRTLPGGPVVRIAVSTTLGAAAQLTVVVDASAGAVTVTLPTALEAGTLWLNIKKIDSSGNIVTINTQGGDTMDGKRITDTLEVEDESLQLHSDGISDFIMI